MRTPRIVDLLREINLFKGLVEGVRRLRAEGAVKTRVGKGSDDLHGERGQPPFRQLAAVAETMPALPLGVPAYSESVFINCPFDDAFRPMFDALVLAVVACGFTPRSALESGTVADLRLDRISSALLASKYSIHDLSRCQGEGDRNLARFNMPIELGMAILYRSMTSGVDQHDWMPLVPERHRHSAFASDLAGVDPPSYQETPESIVPPVMAWLATRLDAPSLPSSLTPQRLVKAALPAFAREQERLQAEWAGHAPWWVLVHAARDLVASRFD